MQRGTRRRSEKRTEEDGQEAGLQQLDLPAIAVPGLSNVNEGEVQQPDQRQEDRIGEPQQHRQRQRGTDDRQGGQQPVGDSEPEHSGPLEKRFGGRSVVLHDPWQVAFGRREPSLPDQRNHLMRQREKGHEVDQAQQSQNEETGKPIGGRRAVLGSAHVGKDTSPGTAGCGSIY